MVDLSIITWDLKLHIFHKCIKINLFYLLNSPYLAAAENKSSIIFPQWPFVSVSLSRPIVTLNTMHFFALLSFDSCASLANSAYRYINNILLHESPHTLMCRRILVSFTYMYDVSICWEHRNMATAAHSLSLRLLN